MLNTLLGWHAQQEFGARFITVAFEQTLAVNESTTLSLADSIDGAALVAALNTDDLLITGVSCRTDPGYAQVTAIPDNNASQKFRVEATNEPIFVPINPAKHVNLDIAVDIVNEGQLNNLYLTFSAIRLNQLKLAEFTLLANSLAKQPLTMQYELINIRKVLENMQAVQQGAAPPWQIDAPITKVSTKEKSFCRT